MPSRCEHDSQQKYVLSYGNTAERSITREGNITIKQTITATEGAVFFCVQLIQQWKEQHRCDGAASQVGLGQRRAAHLQRVTARPADRPVGVAAAAAAAVERRRARCDVDGGNDGRRQTDEDKNAGDNVGSP